jgi:hypothetical protein
MSATSAYKALRITAGEHTGDTRDQNDVTITERAVAIHYLCLESVRSSLVLFARNVDFRPKSVTLTF